MNRILTMKNGYQLSMMFFLITIIVSSVSLMIVDSFQWYDSHTILSKPKFLLSEYGDNNFYRRRRTSSSSSSSCLTLSITNNSHNSFQQRWPCRTFSTRTTIIPRNTKMINTIQLVASTRLAATSNTNELMSLKQGSTVALITPFHKDSGKIDFDSLRNLIQYHIDSGTDNLCLLGTTGEANVLSMSEREQVLQTAIELVKGQIPIMVGCGTIDPNHVKEMIIQANDCGADAALIVTPYYVKPPQRSLIRHYTSIADSSPLPLIIYNVPGRTAVDMSDESIAIAALHDNIVAVKDATGKLSRIESLRQQLEVRNIKREDFLLYSGDDETSMDYVLNGGDGCISVTANIAARPMHELMMASLSNDKTKASTINEPLLILHQKLFCESNPMPIKYAASKIGLIQSPLCRPPLDVLDVTYQHIIDDAIQQAGITV